MKPPTGTGRHGLAVLVTVVLVAHAWVLQAIGTHLGAPAGDTPRPVAFSQVRLVAPEPPDIPPPVRLAAPAPATPAPPPAPAPPRRPPVTATPPATSAGSVPSAPAPEPADPAGADEPGATRADAAPVEAGTPAPTASAPAVSAPVEESPAAEAAPPRIDPSVQPARPVALPPDADLRYQVQGQARGLKYRASGELHWRHRDGRYELSMRLSAFLVGSRSQTSTGRADGSGLLPERFADRSRSEKAAHFDRSAHRIRFSNNAPDAPLLPGAQDRLSVFLQLAGLLQANDLAPGDTIELPVAGVGGSETWRFTVGDTESLDLPAGRWPARRLVREPVDTYDSRVEVWLAPALGHLPVRLRITQSQGDMADQQLSERP